MNEKSSTGDKGMLEFLIWPALIALTLFAVWFIFGARILQNTFLWSQVPFEYFAKMPAFLYPTGMTFEYAKVSQQLITAQSHNYTWATFVQILNLWGYTIRLVLVPFLLLMAFANWGLPLNLRFRRRLDLKSLAEQNSDLFPSIKITIGKDLHKSDPYSGPWRIADDYINFAAFNGLLQYKGSPHKAITEAQRGFSVKAKRKKLFRHHSYMSLDVKKTDDLFTNQLGLPWRGLDCLHPCINALGVALMCIAAGGEYRQKGRDLIDQISATFVETMKDNKPVYSCRYDSVAKLASEVESMETIQNIVNRHAYTSTVFIALLIAARERAGKVPPALFLWLRITDRTLWYTLHPIGGLKPWCEGSAAWCHHLVETALGKPVVSAAIEGATDGLKAELIAEEWITDPYAMTNAKDDEAAKNGP